MDERVLLRHNADKEVYRPIQYLGNKLRSLPHLLQAVDDCNLEGGEFIDLFSGTSVVSQAFALRQYKVTSIDIQKYCNVMGASLLNVGGEENDGNIHDVVKEMIISAKDYWEESEWKILADNEQIALENKDFSHLTEIYKQLPLAWRDKAIYDLESFAGKQGKEVGPLLTTLQSGYYFGVSQSLMIDALRQLIDVYCENGMLSGWGRSACLTALMSAMSSAVHSAGKHFAQPLNVGNSNNSQFLEKRLYEDRNVNIALKFEESLKAITLYMYKGQHKHSVVHSSAEEYMREGKFNNAIIYADPPYTAQQYSRFYHLLETLIEYKIPSMHHSGKITSGLYPVQRYKSAFSSKRLSNNAFSSIISNSKASNSSLLISYSTSSKDSNGNDRMISLSDLLMLCSKEYGSHKVECIEFGHKYRQFNNAASAKTARNDPEILITCKV